MDNLATIREHFLSFLADGNVEITYDGDVTDSGRMIDCSIFEIKGSLSILEEMCEAVGILRNRDESLDDCLTRYIQAEGADG